MPESKKLTKSQLDQIAKIYCASVVFNSLGSGAYSDKMTLGDHTYFADKVKEIAESMAMKTKVGCLAQYEPDLDHIIETARKLKYK